MNHYGTAAQRYWARWLPQRYATITDRDSFFSDLGEEAAQRIADLGLDLAGDDPPGEEYLVKVGRLNMARLQAEEIVLPELILLPPEPGANQDPEDQHQASQDRQDQDREDQDRESRDREEPGRRTLTDQGEIPLVVSRGHPMWEQVNSEQEELALGS
jgi:hypothetical protein